MLQSWPPLVTLVALSPVVDVVGWGDVVVVVLGDCVIMGADVGWLLLLNLLSFSSTILSSITFSRLYGHISVV